MSWIQNYFNRAEKRNKFIIKNKIYLLKGLIVSLLVFFLINKNIIISLVAGFAISLASYIRSSNTLEINKWRKLSTNTKKINSLNDIEKNAEKDVKLNQILQLKEIGYNEDEIIKLEFPKLMHLSSIKS